MKTATRILRHLLAQCVHGRAEHTYCAPCLAAISEGAAS